MPDIKPIKRKDLIYYLKKFNFTGPFSGGKHQFMIKENIRLIIPNPHKGDISSGLLSKILKQAQITKEEWQSI